MKDTLIRDCYAFKVLEKVCDYTKKGRVFRCKVCGTSVITGAVASWLNSLAYDPDRGASASWIRAMIRTCNHAFEWNIMFNGKPPSWLK